ncbi:TonB-dependent siderophore receptor [Formicincola oecophyllae]|uniref:TonB-dependent siderophore receptor n=2 Tax=Formicincola oecophyllae TaxID=2558361 RepID=A0A4Y6UDC1_9PROT|nr:TonB-dependent siderophore receptor [Formicincola oecophyllae]
MALGGIVCAFAQGTPSTQARAPELSSSTSPSKTYLKAQPKPQHLVIHGVRGQADILGADAHYMAQSADLGPLGAQSILNEPFTVDEVRRDVLLNQQVRNINDTAKFMPSVQLEERGDPNISRPQSRGFESDVINNSRMDGLNVLTTTPYAAEQFDHLTVLEGLAGALYGPQNPAGTFNYVLKRPTDKPMAVFNFGADSNGAPLESGDFSGRYGPVGARLNLLNQNGQSYVGGSSLRRDMVSGDFDIHLGRDTTLYVDGSAYSNAWRGLPGAFTFKSGLALPKAPDIARRGYGQRQGGYSTLTETGLARLEHRFNDDWSLRLGGLYQNAARDVFTPNNQIINNRGDYTQTIAAASTANDFAAWSNFAYLNGKVRTGFVRHELVLGSNGYDLGNYNPLWAQSYTLGTTNISNPKVWGGTRPRMGGRYHSANTQVQALLAGDTIHLGRQVTIMGMFSWSWLSVQNWNRQSRLTSAYRRDGAFSPTVTAEYKPLDDVTAYFNWGRSIQPGQLAPTNSTNQGSVMPPMRSEQYEVGAKWRLNDDLMLRADGFVMSRPYAFVDPATMTYGQFGKQRNYGVEFMISGHVTKRLAIMAGMTWLDAQNGRTASALTSHKQVVGVPPIAANILLDYTLPLEGTMLRGAALTANFHYTGRRAADVYNKAFAAAYATLDLGARYATEICHQPLVWRFQVNNVTGERYWASVFPNSQAGGSGNSVAMAGLPRTFQGTVSVAF